MLQYFTHLKTEENTWFACMVGVYVLLLAHGHVLTLGKLS